MKALDVCHLVGTQRDFPGDPSGKESTCNAGDVGLIPEPGRSSGGGNRNPGQYSCLENSMDRGTWQATVHGVAEVDTTEQLSIAQLGRQVQKVDLHPPTRI